MGAPPESDPVREWIDSLDEVEVRDQLQALVRQQLQIQDELGQMSRQMLRRIGQIAQERFELGATQMRRRRSIPEAHLPIAGVPAPVGKKSQVLRAMGQHSRFKVWTAHEIRDDLVRYGWMTSEKRDFASLLSTISRMAKDEYIHRVGRGLYRFAPPEEREE